MTKPLNRSILNAIKVHLGCTRPEAVRFYVQWRCMFDGATTLQVPELIEMCKTIRDMKPLKHTQHNSELKICDIPALDEAARNVVQVSPAERVKIADFVLDVRDCEFV